MDCPFEPSGQLSSREGVSEGIAFVRGKLGDCSFSVSCHEPGIQDRHGPLLDNPAVIAEQIGRYWYKLLVLNEPPGDNTQMLSARGVESVRW